MDMRPKRHFYSRHANFFNDLFNPSRELWRNFVSAGFISVAIPDICGDGQFCSSSFHLLRTRRAYDVALCDTQSSETLDVQAGAFIAKPTARRNTKARIT
jgi:hypothetical protein